MSLTDSEVSAELKKMVAFIRQEAEEKAREIRIKADEEFAIEKSKLVRQEISSIDAQYERRFKQAELAQQIARSTITNKIRLKVLAAQQELLNDIFERARTKLHNVSKDGEKYTAVLKCLILEGMYLLNENHVIVRPRSKDDEFVKKAILEVEREYKEKIGTDVNVGIDENRPLPEDSTGGVIIVGFYGKIDVNNTLEERLSLVQEEGLPAIRVTLFGPNPHRKFYD